PARILVCRTRAGARERFTRTPWGGAYAGTVCDGGVVGDVEGGAGQDADAERGVRGAVLVRVALRGRAGHEPGGAARGGARGLLLDGALGGAVACRAPTGADRDDGQGAPGEGGGRFRDHAGRAGDAGAGSGDRRGDVARVRRGGEAELSGVEAVCGGGDPADGSESDLLTPLSGVRETDVHGRRARPSFFVQGVRVGRPAALATWRPRARPNSA